MSVKARMTVSKIVDYGTTKEIHLSAVYSADKTSPNYSFSQATPSAQVTMTITNPAAFNQFEACKSYDLTFEPTPESPAAV